MSDKIKYTLPKPFYDVFEDIGNTVYEISSEMKDRELYIDFLKDYDKRFYWDEYKSNDEFDKDNIYTSDLVLVSRLICQIILFHRIVKENQIEQKNNPNNEVPYFFRQFDEDGGEKDLYDVSSGKLFIKWGKTPKGKKKLEELKKSK